MSVLFRLACVSFVFTVPRRSRGGMLENILYIFFFLSYLYLILIPLIKWHTSLIMISFIVRNTPFYSFLVCCFPTLCRFHKY